MQTEKSKKFTRRLVIILAALSAIVLLDCIFYHVSILKVISETIDLATHHYFLTAFVSFMVVILCVKYLFDTSVEKSVKLRKQIIRSLKSSRRTSKESSVDAKVVLTAKEEISSMAFPKEDVLKDPFIMAERDSDILKAMKLGNIFKQKVKIFFNDGSKKRYTDTTIWAADRSHINLKNGVVMPIRAIYRIEF